METTKNEKIELLLREANLDEDRSIMIRTKFSELIQLSERMVIIESELLIVDENDYSSMAKAKENYKELASLESRIEAIRVALKSKSLAEGRAIDDVAKTLKALIVPLKDKFKTKSEYRKRWEIEMRQALRAKRRDQLAGLDYDTTIDLAEITEVNFALMEIRLQNEKAEKIKKQEAEKLEADRKIKEAEDQRKRDAEEKTRLEDHIKKLEAEKEALETELKEIVESVIVNPEIPDGTVTNAHEMHDAFFSIKNAEPIELKPVFPSGGKVFNTETDYFKAIAFVTRMRSLYVPTDISDTKIQELVNIAAQSLQRNCEIILKALEDGKEYKV